VDRAQKEATVDGLNKVFSESPHVIVASFSGLTVNQANLLRRNVGDAGGAYRVIKNRLAKRAAAGTPVAAMIDQFRGPCAVATHADDPVGLARAIVGFIKENPQIAIKAGLVDGKAWIDAEGVLQLSKMAGLPELRAQLLALIQTPATMLVRLLGTPATQVARVIDARGREQEHAGR
jgi:large subunit ribosomal protein L10